MTWLVSIEGFRLLAHLCMHLGSLHTHRGEEGAITLSLETSHFSIGFLARTFWAYYCQHGLSRRGSLRSRAFSSYRKTGTQANRPSSHQSKGPMPCRIDPCPLKPPRYFYCQHGLRLFISTVGRRGGANRHRVILRAHLRFIFISAPSTRRTSPLTDSVIGLRSDGSLLLRLRANLYHARGPH